MIWIGEEINFPPYEVANEDGVLAFGGDLSVERLIYAYKKGIFPWFNEGEPIVWYAPQERMVLFPEDVKISKSMKQILRKKDFTITENKVFAEVVFNCKYIDRHDQYGSWITDDMEQAYIELHKKGYAKSIEVWHFDTSQNKNKLVGGLYGVDLGNGVFCGESMFSKVSNMSKVAFIHLAKNLGYKLIDCQVYNEHLASLGAYEIDRSDFLKYL
ncbi:leucyl/phenylalanyl-tRNA--protein transferase [Tenacibaculum sp. E3R01]|uniref:leucyl/phenylalanyl-tRNA--protein transferase n=1 Tax=Tenacibaculum sp. E3R01 TaxID=2267227 RepID=UPI000DEA5570|nr:leucyl/phenylalanyl-tRNA--protein transferase [Tenacibaculum sp. E3R01]RBW62393.1 leucyl/phenylalanyl-tRNA--protein transferase [Tenacibaculum sp. E3R01]